MTLFVDNKTHFLAQLSTQKCVSVIFNLFDDYWNSKSEDGLKLGFKHETLLKNGFLSYREGTKVHP